MRTLVLFILGLLLLACQPNEVDTEGSVGNELCAPDVAWKDIALIPAQLGYVNSMLAYVDEKTCVPITAYQKGTIGTEPYERFALEPQ